jgi:hypothetical protein
MRRSIADRRRARPPRAGGRSASATGRSDQLGVAALEVARVDAEYVMDAPHRVVVVGGEPAEHHSASVVAMQVNADALGADLDVGRPGLPRDDAPPRCTHRPGLP